MRERLILRRFAGLTPYNAADRIQDRRDDAERLRGWRQPPRRWSGYGMQTWDNLFRAFSVFRGRAYRAGDVGRRRKWAL